MRFVGDPVALVVAEIALPRRGRGRARRGRLRAAARRRRRGAARPRDTTLVHPELGSNVAVQSAVATRPRPRRHLRGRAARRRPRPSSSTATQRADGDPRGRGAATRPPPASSTCGSRRRTRTRCARRAPGPRRARAARCGCRCATSAAGSARSTSRQREELTVIAAAHRLGRAVKWIEDRRENLIAANHARADRVTVRLALDEDARLLGVHLDHLEDCGAYPVGGTGGIGPFMAMLFPGPYRIPKLGFTHHRGVDEHLRPGRVPRPVDDGDGRPGGDARPRRPRRRPRPARAAAPQLRAHRRAAVSRPRAAWSSSTSRRPRRWSRRSRSSTTTAVRAEQAAGDGDRLLGVGHRPLRRADQHVVGQPRGGDRDRPGAAERHGDRAPRHRVARPEHRDDDGPGRRRAPRRRRRATSSSCRATRRAPRSAAAPAAAARRSWPAAPPARRRWPCGTRRRQIAAHLLEAAPEDLEVRGRPHHRAGHPDPGRRACPTSRGWR